MRISGRHILQSTAVVSLFTGLSRLLGFVREMLMAYYFGTTLAKSAFDVAFKVPNLFRRLFGEGALSAAFVPVFTAALEEEGEAAARRLAGRVFCLLAGVLMLVTAAGIFLSLVVLPRLLYSERLAAVLPLLAVMLPYMIFICLVAVCMGILNVRRRFAVPAATPIVLNAVWILSLFLLSPLFGETPGTRIYGVAWGILAAGALQLTVQVPALRQVGLLPDFRGCFQPDARVRRILGLMAPAAIGVGFHEINVLVDGMLALYVGTWAPATLTYAERLIYLPLGVFATALATVLLPTFSRHATLGDTRDLIRTFRFSMSGLLLVMIPAAAGLLLLTGPVVQLVFEWKGGEFDAASTVLTARALRWYAPGLVVFSVYKVIVPVFYALQDTRTPVRVGIAAVIFNLVMNVLFVLTWPDGYRHAGLACATVLSQAASGLWLGVLLSRRLPGMQWRRIGGVALRAGLAAALMCLAIAVVMGLFARAFPEPDKGIQTLSVLSSIAAGGAVYGAGAALFCRRELAALVTRLRHRRTP